MHGLSIASVAIRATQYQRLYGFVVTFKQRNGGSNSHNYHMRQYNELYRKVYIECRIDFAIEIGQDLREVATLEIGGAEAFAPPPGGRITMMYGINGNDR